MLNEEGNKVGSTELAKRTGKIYTTTLIGAEMVIAAAAVIFFAALAPGATALIVLGAAALLLILGTLAFHALPWAVRLVAC